MNEEKQTTQTPNLDVFITGYQADQQNNKPGIQPKNELQQESNFICKICNVHFSNKILYQQHIALNLVIFCEICKNSFCGPNKFREHQTECKKRQREIEPSKYYTTTINEDWTCEITEDTKNNIKKIDMDGNKDFELPHTIIKTEENNIQQSINKTNPQIETMRNNNLIPLPKQVPPTFKRTLESQIVKRNFPETRMSKGAEMDTIEIIGQSTISTNSLQLKPNNRQSLVNKMHTSKNIQEEFSSKYIPTIIPKNKIVNSVPNQQTLLIKAALPVATTKKDWNITPWSNFVKILPKPTVAEPKIPRQQTPTISSIGRNVSLGKGIPVQNFLVKSQSTFNTISNQTVVGQTIIRPTSSVPQTAAKELLIKPARSKVFIQVQKGSPRMVQNVVKHQKNNTEHNVQDILKRKELLLGSNVSKQSTASTPILNLPINVRNIQVGSKATRKCIFMKSVLEKVPLNVISKKKQAHLPRIISNPTNFQRRSNPVHSKGSLLMKSIIRPINTENFNFNKNPIQNVDKRGSNLLRTLNVPNTSNAVEHGPYLRIPATDTLMPTTHASFEAQDNLKDKDINTTNNKNELEEMLMDEQELVQLLLLAENMKQTSPTTTTTGLQNNPNLVQSVAPPETNVNSQSQVLNEKPISSEIKTELIDADFYDNLRLMQETEAAIAQSKRNNYCPENNKAIASSTLPSDLYSVEPKIENVEYVDSKFENRDANQNQNLSKQNFISLENIVRLTNEKRAEQVAAPTSSNVPLTTDLKENNKKDTKILPPPEVNKILDAPNLITDSNVSTSKSIQSNISGNLTDEKAISQKSNINEISTAKEALINTLIDDVNNENYEVETLDEDLLESEEFIRNGEKTKLDDDVIEILDDSDVSDVDPEILDTVEEAIKSSGVKKSFYCQKCRLPFCSNTSLGRHVFSNHKQRFCYCNICNPIKENSSKISLISILQHKKNAMKNQTQNYIFYCELCQQRFNNVISFNMHQNNCTMKLQNTKNRFIRQYFNTRKHPRKQTFVLEDGERKTFIRRVYANVISARTKAYCNPLDKHHKCTFCGNTYATLQTRLRHEAGYCTKNVNVVKSNLYSCKTCNKQFTSIITRNFHMKMYCYDKTQEMKFKCRKCDKKFPLQHMLQNHFLVRHVYTYYCDYCQRSFSDKHHLQRHIIGHMGMKPFKCDICSQKFSRKCKLQLHIQRHLNKKDYSCKICNKKFMFKNVLNKHMNTNCSEESIKAYPFLCDICKKRYKDKKQIETHMMNIHVKTFPCNVCDKVFGQKFRLNIHLATHGKKYYCRICKKGFLTKTPFRRHKATHLDHLCECGQKFKLRFEYYKHRTYWCAKTAGKRIDEIVKSDAILSKIKKKSTQTEFVKPKKKLVTIKKIRQLEKEDNGDKKIKIADEMKTVGGDDANNSGLGSTDSDDNCCLQKFVTTKLEDKGSYVETKGNDEVIRDIKKILRKRKNNENSPQDISNKAVTTNKHDVVNKTKSSKLVSSDFALKNTNKTRKENTITRTITTRNKLHIKRKGQIKNNAKVTIKAVNKNVAKKNKDKRSVANMKNKIKRNNTTPSEKRKDVHAENQRRISLRKRKNIK